MLKEAYIWSMKPFFVKHKVSTLGTWCSSQQVVITIFNRTTLLQAAFMAVKWNLFCSSKKGEKIGFLCLNFKDSSGRQDMRHSHCRQNATKHGFKPCAINIPDKIAAFNAFKELRAYNRKIIFINLFCTIISAFKENILADHNYLGREEEKFKFLIVVQSLSTSIQTPW